jgi:hypothetical protein
MIKKFGKIISIILVLLLGGVAVFFDDLVTYQLNRLIQNRFNGYYTLEFKDASRHYSWNSISFSFEEVVFETDTTRLENEFPVVFFTSKKIDVSGIDLWKVFFGKQLAIDKIDVEKPALTYVLNKTIQHGKTDAIANNRSALSFFGVQHIRLNDGELDVISFDTKKQVLVADKMSLWLERFQVNLDQIHFSAKQAFFLAEDAAFTPENGLYDFAITKFYFDKRRGLSEFKDIEIHTKQDVKEQSKQLNYSKALFNARIDMLSILGIHTDALIYNGNIHADQVLINQGYFSLFKNDSKLKDKSKAKPMISELINNIGVSMKIDTVKLLNTAMDIRLFKQERNREAIITLAPLNLTATQISNYPEFKKPMSIQAQARLMNAGALTLNMAYDMNDTADNSHVFYGTISTMELNRWNGVLANFTNISMRQGLLEKLTFEGKIKGDEVTGNLSFFYSDLAVELYSDEHAKKRKLLSVIARLGYHKSNTPETKRAVVPFYAKRDKWQGNLTLLISGVLDGVLTTVLTDAGEKVAKK